MNLKDIMKLYNIKKYQDDGLFGNNIKIAIIDTGANEEHINYEKIIYKENFTQDNNGVTRSVKDYHSHGTLVSSIIQSIAPNVELVILKAIPRNFSTLSSFVGCVRKALELKVDIMNISMNCANNYLTLENLIERECEDKIILVASGNGHNKNGFFPACYKNVVSIGSCNDRGEQSSFSNNSKDNIYILGENISIKLKNDVSYVKNGTSFSCAIASGICVLLLEKYKKIYKNDIELKRVVINKLREISLVW